jgi:hypothetical protein
MLNKYEKSTENMLKIEMCARKVEKAVECVEVSLQIMLN